LTSAKPSSRRVEREDVLLWLFAFIPVAAWITAQQLSFLATRSICANGRRSVLYLVMGPALAAAAAAGVASWTKWRALVSKKSADSAYRRFMALGGVMLAAICAGSILSLMIAAALQGLCD
jgi:hypothetical protein